MGRYEDPLLILFTTSYVYFQLLLKKKSIEKRKRKKYQVYLPNVCDFVVSKSNPLQIEYLGW